MGFRVSRNEVSLYGVLYELCRGWAYIGYIGILFPTAENQMDKKMVKLKETWVI